MVELGKRLTCDRCGESIFLKHLETKTIPREWQDAKIIEVYEEAEGWKTRHYVGDLCPTCAEEHELLLREFMEVHP
jgi:hypothetical protein